jgi:predicted ester cyclase
MKNLIKSSLSVVAASLIIVLSGCGNKGMPPEVRATMEKYIGYWNSGRFDGIEDVMTDDFEILESPGYEPQRGLNAFKMLISNTRRTYPDFRVEINETVYERGKIAFIWTVTGTNSGPGDVPPTGRSINGKGISVLHLEGGKIKDEWLSNNNLLFMMQMGFTLVPPQEIKPQ